MTKKTGSGATECQRLWRFISKCCFLLQSLSCLCVYSSFSLIVGGNWNLLWSDSWLVNSIPLKAVPVFQASQTFPPVVLSHIACCLLYTHRISVSGGEESCFDCVKLCDKFSFAPVWMWGTGFVTVSKIPLVHSCTGSRNSFPVIQDTRSHYSGHHAFGISVWETLRRGSAQKFRAVTWACGTRPKYWSWSKCSMD